jgi:hypothetical protein
VGLSLALVTAAQSSIIALPIRDSSAARSWRSHGER